MGFIIAFIGGLISFVSPCVLPLIPIYIAYSSGISIPVLKGSPMEKPLLKIFLNSLLFVAGFAIVFSTLAALFYIFVQWLGSYKIWFNRIAGAIIILFGLQIMGILKLKFLNAQASLQTRPGKSNFLSSFLLGVAFGAGWTPCIGPILSGILFTSTASQSPAAAVLLLLTYSLGLGLPFILTGLLTNRLLSVIDALKKHYRLIEIVSGVFLVLLGLMLFFDRLGSLSGWLSGLLPGLGNIEDKFFH